jgi:hypothetical protein
MLLKAGIMLKDQKDVYTSHVGDRKRVLDPRQHDVMNLNISMLDLQNIEDEDVIECYEHLVANNFTDEDEMNFNQMMKLL